MTVCTGCDVIDYCLKSCLLYEPFICFAGDTLPGAHRICLAQEGMIVFQPVFDRFPVCNVMMCGCIPNESV